MDERSSKTKNVPQGRRIGVTIKISVNYDKYY